MIQQPYHLYTERTDPAKNMARYERARWSDPIDQEPVLAEEEGGADELRRSTPTTA